MSTLFEEASCGGSTLNLYDLGTGSSFDVSGYEGFENFTVNDFLVREFNGWTGWRGFDSGNNKEMYFTSNTFTRNYNSKTGVFTISQSLNYHFGGGTASGHTNITGGTFRVYLISKKRNTSGGSGGNSLEALGFINIPEGEWVMKSTLKDDVFPGFSENVIPLTMSFSGVNGSSSHGNCTWGSLDCSASRSLNGKTTVATSGHMSFDISRGGARVSCGGSASHIYIPAFYNFDLTAIQKGVTSGTITCWLQK